MTRTLLSVAAVGECAVFLHACQGVESVAIAGEWMDCPLRGGAQSTALHSESAFSFFFFVTGKSCLPGLFARQGVGTVAIAGEWMDCLFAEVIRVPHCSVKIPFLLVGVPQCTYK